MSLENGKPRDIDYNGVLSYFEKNQEVPYFNPDKPGISKAAREQMLAVKEGGEKAVAEMEKMAKACMAEYNLDKCLPIAWLDSSNTKTRKYLVAQMKYSNYSEDPTSLSIFVEKDGNQFPRYRISLDIKNDGASKETMERFHSFLDLPIDKSSGLVCVHGRNAWGNPEVIDNDQSEIRDRISKRELRKVQLCKYIQRADDESNEYYHDELIKAVGELIPFYEHVLGIEKPVYWPSKEEYDPGITIEDWIDILNKPDCTTDSILQLLSAMVDIGGEATCTKLAEIYGGNHNTYNGAGQDLGRRVHNNYGIPLCKDGNDERLFPISFVGRYVNENGNKRYSWKLRDELSKALKTIDLPDPKRGKEKSMNTFGLNTILYGPPGTGKTYNTVKYAVAICDEVPIDSIVDYAEALRRFNELKREGRIAFTTFHQSYGYEEFIEGIKPIMVSDASSSEKKDVSYDIIPGAFKEFCDNAKKKVIDTKSFTIEEGAVVWKATVLDEVRQDCFDNNRVRIDWKINSAGASGFVNDITRGDIIITTDRNRRRINGIAIVTSDEAYELDGTEHNVTTRDVKWLAKNIDVDITDINSGKMLHRMTVARVPFMSTDDIVALAVKESGGFEDTTIEENTKPYVFIIDEINRGNISKIFGELITLIEESKRAGAEEAMTAKLPYSGELFSVPKNVYILGTMNTADRSIALMDTALRRRFDFEERMPDANVLEGITVTHDGVSVDIAEMLRTINQRIEYLYDREHTIGHAFFIKLRKKPTLKVLAEIFRNNVVPLLQEYFYEDYEKIQMVLGDNGKSSSDYQFIKDEKFEARDIFVGNINYDNLDIIEKKFKIQSSAFDKIQSYKEIGRNI